MQEDVTGAPGAPEAGPGGAGGFGEETGGRPQPLGRGGVSLAGAGGARSPATSHLRTPGGCSAAASAGLRTRASASAGCPCPARPRPPPGKGSLLKRGPPTTGKGHHTPAHGHRPSFPRTQILHAGQQGPQTFRLNALSLHPAELVAGPPLAARSPAAEPRSRASRRSAAAMTHTCKAPPSPASTCPGNAGS